LQKTFIEDYKDKLLLLGYEKRKMSELETQLGPDKEINEEYKNARKRAELLMSSLPFAEVPALNKIIHAITSQQDQFKSSGVDDWFLQQMDKDIQKSLSIALREVRQGQTQLQEQASGKKDMNTATKESLAQDTDLVEGLRQDSNQSSQPIQAVVCRVDTVYGSGAQVRDDTLLAISVLGGPIGGGLARLGAKAMASGIAGAAAAGNFTIRTANFLRIVSAGTSIVTGAEHMINSCVGDSPHLAGDSAKTCDVKSIGMSPIENCVLGTALFGLGYKNMAALSKTLTAPASILSQEATQAAALQNQEVIQKEAALNRLLSRVAAQKNPSLGTIDLTAAPKTEHELPRELKKQLNIAKNPQFRSRAMAVMKDVKNLPAFEAKQAEKAARETAKAREVPSLTTLDGKDLSMTHEQQMHPELRMNPPRFPTTTIQKEDLNEHLGRSQKFGNSKVIYAGPTNRANFKVKVDDDGLFHDAKGNLLDTTNASSAHYGNGNAIFVMDNQGDIYVSKLQKMGVLHHSTMLDGRPAAMAGELIIKDGKLIAFSDSSGHYKPGDVQVKRFLARLKELGVKVDDVVFESQKTAEKNKFFKPPNLPKAPPKSEPQFINGNHRVK
jgi:hypothetical protein